MEIVVNRGFRGEVTEETAFYNLDAIISVGYRVNSKEATRIVPISSAQMVSTQMTQFGRNAIVPPAVTQIPKFLLRTT